MDTGDECETPFDQRLTQHGSMVISVSDKPILSHLQPTFSIIIITVLIGCIEKQGL